MQLLKFIKFRNYYSKNGLISIKKVINENPNTVIINKFFYRIRQKIRKKC